MQDRYSSLFSNSADNNHIQSSQLDQAKTLAQNLLGQFAATPGFDSDLQLAFGDVETDSLKTSWINGEFVFPEIEIVNDAEINNANGAFARETGKIYLAQEFLLTNQSNPDTISNILLEEYGHFIDSQLNLNDSPGDEGAIFAALVQGEDLSISELQQLINEDDTATVTLDGKTIEIEQSFTDLINGLGGSGELNNDNGFGENFLPRHDDSLDGDTDTTDTDEQSSDETNTEEINEVFEVSLTGVFEGGINFYGETYDKFYVNNNGNVTFDAPLATFTPTDLASEKIIAPFFADVDTRENNIETSPGGNSQGTNLVYYDVNPDAGEITVTWDDVGKYPNETIPNAFQLILRDLTPEGEENFQEAVGNYEIEFRYEEIQWTVGGASEDVYARVGFSGGDIANFYELPFSNNLEELLQLEAGTNVNQPGKFVFNFLDGEPQVDEEAYSLIPTTTVHRFYQYEKDFYLYSADETEIEVVKGRSAAGRQEYDYEYDGEKFRVLTSDKDAFTGETIEGAKPVYRYLNTETDSYLYTMDENEMNYIEDNLTNYRKVNDETQTSSSIQNEVDFIENSLLNQNNQGSDGADFYAFESEDAPIFVPENPGEERPIPVPVYRMLNSESGSHYLTTDINAAMSLESNFPHFSLENNEEPVFYVFEL